MRKNKIKHLQKINFLKFESYSIIKCLVISKDEIALSFINGEIIFYNLYSLKPNIKIKEFNNPVNNFFKVKENIFFSSSENIIKIFKILTNKKYEIIQEFKDLNFIKISAIILSNRKLLLCLDYQFFHIYSTINNKELFQKELSININEGISFFFEIPNNELLISNKNNIISIYDFNFKYMFSFFHNIFPHSNNFVMLSNDIILFTHEKTINFYNIRKKNIIKVIEIQNKINIFYLINSNTFIMTDNQFNIKEFYFNYDQFNLVCVLEKRKSHNSSISQIIKLNNEKYISISYDGLVNFWEIY